MGGIVLQGPVLLDEHFFSCFIHGGSIACLVTKNHSKTVKKLEVAVLRVQLVIWVLISKIKKRICNLTIRLPSFASGFLSVALALKQEMVSQPVKE